MHFAIIVLLIHAALLRLCRRYIARDNERMRGAFKDHLDNQLPLTSLSVAEKEGRARPHSIVGFGHGIRANSTFWFFTGCVVLRCSFYWYITVTTQCSVVGLEVCDFVVPSLF